MDSFAEDDSISPPEASTTIPTHQYFEIELQFEIQPYPSKYAYSPAQISILTPSARIPFPALQTPRGLTLPHPSSAFDPPRLPRSKILRYGHPTASDIFLTREVKTPPRFTSKRAYLSDIGSTAWYSWDCMMEPRRIKSF